MNESQTNDVTVLDGPMPHIRGGIIYEVTMPSGMIVTSPDGFGNGGVLIVGSRVIITHDGRVLAKPPVQPTPVEGLETVPEKVTSSPHR